MIYSVRGTLILMEAGFAVVECGGVGYRVQTSISTQKQLKLNSEVMLYTHMNVREDAMELFGFATKSELNTFRMLIGITGVGPKVALAILSELSSEQIAMCVSAGDSKTLTRANGVGPKLAQRIVLELKDKLAKAVGSADGMPIPTAAAAAVQGNVPKAIEALGVLGYTPAEVSPVLATLDSSLPVEQLIAMTLRQMGRQ